MLLCWSEITAVSRKQSLQLLTTSYCKQEVQTGCARQVACGMLGLALLLLSTRLANLANLSAQQPQMGLQAACAHSPLGSCVKATPPLIVIGFT